MRKVLTFLAPALVLTLILFVLGQPTAKASNVKPPDIASKRCSKTVLDKLLTGATTVNIIIDSETMDIGIAHNGATATATDNLPRAREKIAISTIILDQSGKATAPSGNCLNKITPANNHAT